MHGKYYVFPAPPLQAALQEFTSHTGTDFITQPHR